MKKSERHYTEEELLFHALADLPPDASGQIAAHISGCAECSAVLNDYQTVRSQIVRWRVEEPSEESWARQKFMLLDAFRSHSHELRQRGFLRTVRRAFRSAWDYALENPLAAMGYVAAAVAFASERTITLFRLDHLLPNTNEVLELLKQVF